MDLPHRRQVRLSVQIRPLARRSGSSSSSSLRATTRAARWPLAPLRRARTVVTAEPSPGAATS